MTCLIRLLIRIVCFLSMIYSYSFIPIITKPTRITDNSRTFLDNFFVRNPIDYDAAIIIADYSNHFPIILNYNISNASIADFQPKYIEYRKINDSTLTLLYTSISVSDFAHIANYDDVNTSISEFDNIMMHHYNTNGPLVKRQISCKDAIKPWITNDLKCDIKRRQNLFLLRRLGKITTAAYNRFRNLVTELRNAKRDYYHRKFNAIKNDIKKTLSLINEILKPDSRHGRGMIRELIVDGKSLTDPVEICNAFNCYFAGVGRDTNDSAPETELSYETFMQGNFVDSFYFSPVTASDINGTILALRSK